jgi:CheY-like chemotaxis protein
MAIRVLIINRQLVFAVTLKQALEQTGTFDVHPFTTVDAAFDFLRDHPQDVALVDFTLPGSSGGKIIQELREIQHDLAVIISPRQPDSDVLLKGLRAQGMVDMPFGARDIIPLIAQAVEQMQQSVPEDDEFEFGPVVDEESLSVDQSFGVTRQLHDQQPEVDPLDDLPWLKKPQQDPYQTRNLEEDGPPPPPATPYPAQTRNLDDGSDPGGSPYPAQTRNLDREEDAPPIKPLGDDYGKTRDLSDDELFPPKPRRSGKQTTRNLESDPPTKSEVSSLENVLKSFGFDPPTGDEDTPAVPSSDNEALRQFLATGGTSGDEAQPFDNVLGAIDSEKVEETPRRETDFDALVKSMKGDEPGRGLPDRQQQLLDFVLTSGMDSVLREIEKSKTGPLEDEPPRPSTMPEEPRKRKSKGGSFQKLAKEEPPLPSLEEGGTVSDLMLGVSDRGFRNVLSLLRGDELDESEVSDYSAPSSANRDRFAEYFSTSTGQPNLPEAEDPAQLRSLPAREPEPRSDTFNFDDLPEADDEATVAEVILKAALQELDLPEGFSLNQLLTDIENRLSIHKLNVRPLPSWNMDTSAFRPVTEAEIREPDFLPEQMPPGEVVDEGAALEFEEPENVTGHTTRPSLASQQTLGVFPEDADTLFDSKFIKETMSPPTVVEEPSDGPELEEAVESERPSEISDDELPDWLPEEPSIDAEMVNEPAPMEEALSEDTAPSLALTSVDDAVTESDKVQSDETWDIRIVPDDEVVEPAADEETPLSEEQAEFEGALEGWSLEHDTQETTEQWGAHPEMEETPIVSEEQAEFNEVLDNWSFEAEAHETAEQWAVEPELEPVGDTEPVAEDAYLYAPPPPEGARDLGEGDEAVQAEAIPEDPYIAQLALNLTQFSLESSSEGTLLTSGGEIVAYAGHLSIEDANELRDTIHNDWDANAEGARIRYVTLPSSGKDYMLYSIRTDNNLTLSMIFAGTTPLRVIRQQGHKLIAALESIPDIPVEEAPPEVMPEMVETPESAALVPVETYVDETLLNAYTYVWLLRDPNGHLNDGAAQAIMSGLNIQLRELGWSIRELQVQEDYVYLYAGVPGENPPHEVMRELKRRSAEIAHAQNPDITPQMLWADAYLILTPGRELPTEEILEFVNFQRMV